MLRDLEQDRTGEMRDIVQTIHASQYELVRSPLDQLLVIQGGPGTGKTAVALHRVSWLLYNHRGDLSPEDVLVIGPNPTFTRYIRSVLPGLGDTDVQHKDLRSLGPISSNGRHEEVDAQRLKGSSRMAELLSTALWQRVRFPQDAEHIDVGQAGNRTQLARTQVEPALRKFKQNSSTYAAGRLAFRAWVTDQVARNTAATVIDNAVERVWPSLSPQMFLRDLFSSRERLVAAAGDDFTAGDIRRMLRTSAARVSEETWSDADVALLDEAQSLINGRPKAHRHVVIDEAQDLSPMQLRSARRRSLNGSMTVVGDVAQSTGPWRRDSWDEIVEALEQRWEPHIEELTLGYRVPQQIYSLAARLLPLTAPDLTPPRVVRTGPEEPQLIECDPEDAIDHAMTASRDYAGRGLFVGVILPELRRNELEQRFDKAGIKWSDANSGNLSKSINVLTAEQAKGLEFDAVVLLEPEQIAAESESGLRLLYIAMTRSTRFLTVAYSGVLIPDADSGAAPPTPEAEATAIVPTERLDTPEEPRTGEQKPAATSASPAASVPEGSARPPASTGASSDQVGRTDGSRQGATTLSSPTVSASAQPADEADAVLTRQLSGMIAAALADRIRSSASPAMYADVIEALRHELGVSEEDVLERLGE